MIKSKKISTCISLVIAVIIIYNSFGYLCFLLPSKLLIKEFVHRAIEKEEMDPSELSILIFNLHDLKSNKYDFEWEKLNKEFRFNGKMYDVEKSEIKGDSIYFKCYYDHKENILEEIMALYFYNNKKDKTHNISNHLLFFGLYSESIKDNKLIQNNAAANIRPLKTEDRIMDHIKDVLTPPPQLIS